MPGIWICLFYVPYSIHSRFFGITNIAFFYCYGNIIDIAVVPTQSLFGETKSTPTGKKLSLLPTLFILKPAWPLKGLARSRVLFPWHCRDTHSYRCKQQVKLIPEAMLMVKRLLPVARMPLSNANVFEESDVPIVAARAVPVLDNRSVFNNWLPEVKFKVPAVVPEPAMVRLEFDEPFSVPRPEIFPLIVSRCLMNP